MNKDPKESTRAEDVSTGHTRPDRFFRWLAILWVFGFGVIVGAIGHRIAVEQPAGEHDQELTDIEHLWSEGELEMAAGLAARLEEKPSAAYAARLWRERIQDRQVLLGESGRLYQVLSSRITAMPHDTPLEEARTIRAEMDDQVVALDPSHRDLLRKDWQAKQASIASHWKTVLGGLVADSTPGGAEVLVGGDIVATTPLRLAGLAEGKYPVRIVQHGYEPWEQQVEVRGGQFVDLGTVELRRGAGGIKLPAVPDGLPWRVKGAEPQTQDVEHRGQGPANVEDLPTGMYHVQFGPLPGWPDDLPYAREVRIEAHQMAEVPFETGILVLHVEGPQAGEWRLEIGGAAVTPEVKNRFRLPANQDLDVTVKAEGWEPVDGAIRLDPNGERAVTLTLQRPEWTVLFRSKYPAHWDTRIPETDFAYAIPLSEAPENMEYLRFRRMDTDNSVIIPLSHSQLRETVDLGDSFVWKGTARYERRFPHGQMNDNYLLGIANRQWEAPYRQGTFILRKEGSSRSGYRGWGFGKRAFLNSNQIWSWNGEQIDPSVFEIAVKRGPLTSEEQQSLLLERAIE